MKHLILTACLLVVSAPAVLISQNRLPVREYVNPEELVTLGRETTFPQAVEVLNSFSRRFTDKILIDRSGKTGPIGLNIPNMQWQQALEYIVSFNGLILVEQSSYFEINAPMVESDAAEAAPGGEQKQPAATIRTREVEISAIFFQGDRRQLQEIGVDWSTLKDGVVQVRNLAAANVSQEVFSIGFPQQALGGGFEIEALLSAFEANNIGDILASPTIKVQEGRQGRVQIGQDFSIKQRDFAGNVIDNFVSTGTILQVTPEVITDQDTTFIHLSITAERSNAIPDPISTIINKQQAESYVMLYSGESTAIAGLFEASETRVRRGVPFLKDLPPWVLGLRYIFGYNSTDIQHRELVIIIKAELMPTIPSRINAPERNTMRDQLEAERARIIQGATSTGGKP